MANLTDVYGPSVVSQPAVALAIEAGIEAVIVSIMAQNYSLSKVQLLVAVKDALESSNPPLSEGLNLPLLDAVLDYMQLKGHSPVLDALAIPTMLNQDGPASVSAARDGGENTQVNVSFSAPPEDFAAAIYLDGVFVKVSVAVASEGWQHDTIQGVEAGAHTVRVLFVRDSDGATTRFGPIGNVA